MADAKPWDPWTTAEFTAEVTVPDPTTGVGQTYKDTIRFFALGQIAFMSAQGAVRLNAQALRELGEFLIEGAEAMEARA